MNFSTDCINESANTTHIIVKRSNQTIRHIVSGDRYASMKFDWVPHNIISVCVREVCKAIIDEDKDECIQCLVTVAEWRAIAIEFEMLVVL